MQYSAELRAAVIADIMAGNTVLYVAAKHGVGRTTVKRWARNPQAVAVVPRTELYRLTPEELGSRVDQLVAANLESLRAVDALLLDPEWLKRQEANALGILYGIIYDKTERILGFRRRSARQAAE